MDYLSTTTKIGFTGMIVLIGMFVSFSSFAQGPETGEPQGTQLPPEFGSSVPPLSERAQNRIVNLERNLFGRMEAAVERFKQIERRLERRIAYLTNAGGNTERLQERLEQVKIDTIMILPGEAELMGLGQGRVSYIGTVASSPDPQSTWENAKAEYTMMVDALQNVKTSLKQIVTDLYIVQSTVGDTSQSNLPLFEESTGGTTTIQTGPGSDDASSTEEDSGVNVN